MSSPQTGHSPGLEDSSQLRVLRPKEGEEGPVLVPKFSIDDDVRKGSKASALEVADFEHDFEPGSAEPNFTLLYLQTLAILLGRSLVLPILVFFADGLWRKAGNAKALPQQQQTLLASGFYLMYATGGLVWCSISNRYGRRPVIIICSFGMAMGFFGQGSASNYWVLLVFRTMCGLFAACPGVAQTYITDVSTPENIPKYTATMGYVYGGAWAFGPLMACGFRVIVNAIQPSDEYDTFQYAIGFYIAALMNVAMGILCWMYLPESLQFDEQNPAGELEEETGRVYGTMSQRTSISHHSGSMMLLPELPPMQEVAAEDLASWQNIQYIVPLIICIFAGVQDLATGTYLAIFPDILKSDSTSPPRTWSPWDSNKMAFVFFAYGVSFSSVQFFYVVIERAVGPLYTHALGTLSSFVGLLAITLVIELPWAFTTVASQMTVIIPFGMVFGMGYGISATAQQSGIAAYANPEDIASWMGWWIFMTCFGCFSTLFESMIADKMGHSTLPLYFSLVALTFTMSAHIFTAYFTRRAAPAAISEVVDTITKTDIGSIVNTPGLLPALSRRHSGYSTSRFSMFSDAPTHATAASRRSVASAHTNLVSPFGIPIMTPSRMSVAIEHGSAGSICDHSMGRPSIGSLYDFRLPEAADPNAPDVTSRTLNLPVIPGMEQRYSSTQDPPPPPHEADDDPQTVDHIPRPI